MNNINNIEYNVVNFYLTNVKFLILIFSILWNNYVYMQL